MLRTVAETAGPEAVASLRLKALLRGPSRNHWNYCFKQHKHLWQMFDDAYTPMAVAQAVEQGLLDPATTRNCFAPDQRNIVYGDGKV